LHRIRAITLDLDDTLWAIGPVIVLAEEKLWSWLGEHFPKITETYTPDAAYALREQVMQKHWDQSHDFRFLRKTVLEHMAEGVGYSSDLVDDAFDVFDRARNDVELFSDVLPTLEALGEHFALVAVTNGNANLECIGIRHLFHDVVTAVDVGAAKPARPIFVEAVSRAGVSAEEVLHVGDHPDIDIDGARKAGMRTAWMNRHGDGWPLHIVPPDVTVSTIRELIAVLEPAIANRSASAANE
jgi:FMN hydrolase / 5-amino-6-(5-phospho-D-ribitylamino)uracil phosphatase